MSSMKTAISIPDPLFDAADSLARRLGVSRSELYARAVAAFVKNDRYRGVREALDEVCAAEPSSLDPKLAVLQSMSLEEDDW